MASAARLPYQRLRNEGFSPIHDDILESYRSITGARTWWKFRRIPLRRRVRDRVPGLRRFKRRRARFVATCRKVLKRSKESQSRFSDLFTGNYLFLQVNPTHLKAFFLQKHYEIHQATPGMPSVISVP